MQAEFVVGELVQKREHGKRAHRTQRTHVPVITQTIGLICVCVAAGESHWSSLRAQPVFSPLSLISLSLPVLILLLSSKSNCLQ